MGGLARAAGSAQLNGAGPTPIWLEGAAAVLPREPGGPVLWLVDIDEPAVRELAKRVAPLPVDLAAFADRRDATERLLRRRLARLMLAAAAGVPVETVSIAATRLGAPVVETPAGRRLSVAARWPACLIGIAEVPIGVDVELATTPLPDDLLTEREREAIGALPDAAMAGASAWAAKEAHAKWTGRARALDPAVVESSEAGVVSSTLGRSRCWRREVGRLTLAVCTNLPVIPALSRDPSSDERDAQLAKDRTCTPMDPGSRPG